MGGRKKYHLEAARASETKLKGCGQKEVNGTTIIYSSVQGVGRKRRSKAEVALQVQGSGVSFIQVYTPTEDKDKETKEDFMQP